jgi:ribonuclease G
LPRRELLIAAGPGEWRAVLVEDGAAVELFVERGEGAEAGSIHLGRMIRKLPALAAVLVDIGGDRPVFLPERDILPRGGRLAEGECAVVQIRREAQGGKSPRGTMRLNLRGRFVELGSAHKGLVGGEALATEYGTRLLAILAGSAPAGTAGLKIVAAAPIDTLVVEAVLLTRRWGEINDRAATLDPPARLDPPASIAAALAGAMPFLPEKVVVDDPAAIPGIRAAIPGAAVTHQAEALWPIDVDALFDEALSPTIVLDGGGAVHIEAVRAAVLIDVDSGSPSGGSPQMGSPERAGLAADLAAAAVIARQMRLRNLGGGIVVDFIGLDRPRSRDAVRAALGKALQPDPARPQILGWTRLGHLELVRPRHGRPLAEALCERFADGALVKSAATIAYEALRAVRRAARAEPGRHWDLRAAPEVAAALSGALAAARRALETRLAGGIAITAEPGRRRDQFDIAAR